jgi:iron complex outermembrane receptor protein
MEERSPGSYRFSIRGSSLRSPFGVRNVKFYWNGLPLTDGGGNTYLNLLDFGALNSMEIIKGPGGSLYGAGTGGVVLLQSADNKNEFQGSVSGGSYGLFRAQAGGDLVRRDKFQLNLRGGYQRSDGYREQTAMNRWMAQAGWKHTLSARTSLTGTIFSTRLYYQTPGGLTKAQYDADPRQARPSTPTAAGAVDQQAAITNQTTYGGMVLEQRWNDRWTSHIGVFGSVTDFSNPTIRNYEIRHEENWGGRGDTQAQFTISRVSGKITAGIEYQHFFSPDVVYDNNGGSVGNIQTDDQLRSQMAIGFLQAELNLPHQWFITIGGSGNFIQYDFLRVSLNPEVKQQRAFNPVFSPRLALLKKMSDSFSLYASVSNGFSPPSLAEVRPSTGAFNNGLNPEQGTSYEAGLKLNTPAGWAINLAAYDFRLNETIVIQRDASGADYFINAGATAQQGVELSVGWTRILPEGILRNLRVWTSQTFNHYTFDSYINDGKDYSGHPLTGVPEVTVATGIDLVFRKGLYANITSYYSDRIPLNDGTTSYASDYLLLGTKIGYRFATRAPLECFFGADNLLDTKYSLGNDLNAVGGRYFNAAPGRNYYMGLSVQLSR